MQTSLLFVMCSALLPLLSTAEVEFKFETTRSDVVRDERDSGRIRGIRNRENKTFVLGALFPLRLHSPNSEGPPCGEPRKSRGVERVEAVLYAIDIINADSNLLPGVELGYDIRDTCFSETVGLDEAIDLIITGSDLVIESCDVTGGAANSTAYAVAPTSGIIGAAGSRVSVPVASLGRLFETPQISYASTSPLLSDRTRYSYFRRTVPADDLQVLAIIDILKRYSWNYVSILHSEDTYGSSGINEFVNVSAENGICIDLRRGIPPSFSGNDFDNLVSDLSNSRANVMVFFATQDSVTEVLTRVNANDTLRRKFTWIASDGWAHAIDVVHQFNDTAVGVLGVAPLTEYQGNFDDYLSKLTLNSNKRNDFFPEFFAAFANCTLGDDCDNNVPITSFPQYQQGSFLPLVIDAVYAFAHALHSFLVDNCNATESAPFLWLNESGRCMGQSRELNGSSLLEYLDKVNFKSITNNTVFFSESGSVLGSYEVFNYQASFSSTGDVTGYQLKAVGSWVNGELTIVDDTELQFGLNSDDSLRREPIESQCGGCSPGMYIREIPGACCAICEPCLGANYSSEPSAKQCNSCLTTGEMWGNNPFSGSNSCVAIPETSAMYSDPWAIPSLIIACIGVLCVAATAVIFGVYWKTPVIKSSGREQMTLLLIGISCSFILPFFYVAPPSIPICLVNRLGIWFCYSLMFAALAVKVQRVARIFYGVKRNVHYKPLFATPIYQVIFTLMLVTIQMIPIIISVAIVHPDVLRTLRYDQDSEGRLGLPEVVITCRREETAVIALSLIYETCIIAVATILGVFSFNFPKNFNEAKYISFCTFSLLVVWVGLIPTYFTTESRPEIQNAAISLFITMSAFGVLCFIFGPKLFIVVFRPDKNYPTTQHTKNDTENGTQEKQSALSPSKFESD
jgi:hypothetical protein